MAQLNNVTPLFKDLAKVEHEHNLACQECSLYRLCLPLGLHSNDLAQLDKILKRSQSYARGQSLFDPDSPFNSIFVVRSGFFKTTVQASDGREQVTGFYFPGEFIGMDAIYQQAYQSTAKALESGSVCELPFDKLQELGATMPQLQVQMMSRLSKELSGDKSLMFLLGKKPRKKSWRHFCCRFPGAFRSAVFQRKSFSSACRGAISPITSVLPSKPSAGCLPAFRMKA